MNNKEQKLLALFNEWEGCAACELGVLRKDNFDKTGGRTGNIAFGDGNADADIFIIGTAPAEKEDMAGNVFVGESGVVLDEYLDNVGLTRKEVFCTNTVACRAYSTTKNESGRIRESNRDPSLAERKTCRALWKEELYIVDPLIIIALGNIAISEVTKVRCGAVTSVQGTLGSCRIQGRAVEIEYPVMHMYHPAHLARSGDSLYGGIWHQQLIAFRRTIYLLDKLRASHYGTPIPERDFNEEDLFIVEGGLPK
jgi:DNA polymerase